MAITLSNDLITELKTTTQATVSNNSFVFADPISIIFG
jgi:hypothetical protein